MPDSNTIDAAIARSISIFLANPNASDGEICSAMTAAEISPQQAARLIVFTPLAFGRALLQKLDIRTPDSFIRRFPDGDAPNESSLSSEPLWQEVSAFARRACRQMNREKMLLIAGRSPEIDAVNQLLNRGIKREDIRLTPLVLSFDLQ